MRTVTPCFLRYETRGVLNLAYDSVNLYQHMSFLMCQFALSKVTCIVMPPFTPNQFMLDKHRRSKGEEDWHIFGECVRKAMCEASGMRLGARLGHADKFLYKDYMGSVIDKVDI